MHFHRPHILLLLLLAFAGNAQGGDSDRPASTLLLAVRSAQGKSIELTAEQWGALPHVSVTTVEHGGENATFEGVPVADLLQRVGAPLGPELNGKNLRYYVVARAADGYEVVFALAEFDSAFSDRVILVADRRNGEVIDATAGPLRFVVPGDRRQARWIRKVETITIYQHAP